MPYSTIKQLNPKLKAKLSKLNPPEHIRDVIYQLGLGVASITPFSGVLTSCITLIKEIDGLSRKVRIVRYGLY
jgi:hypothetical protein